MTASALGFHRLIELDGCDRALITDAAFVRRTLVETTREAGGTVVAEVFHEFNPFGLSGVVVIAESHIAVHTWPEHGCVSVDVFSCTRKLDSQYIETQLALLFCAARVSSVEFERGRASELIAHRPYLDGGSPA